MRSSGVIREVWTIYAKEALSLGRDRHTVIYSVLVPLFLYPALLLGTLQVIAYIKGIQEHRVLRVGVPGEERHEAFIEFLAARKGLQVISLAEAESALMPAAAFEARARRSIIGEEVDAVLSLRSPEAPAPPGGRVEARVLYSGARDASGEARKRIETALDDFRGELLLQGARSLGEDASFLHVLELTVENLATSQELTNYLAGLMLPFLMIAMIAMGALYPALDCTVGEKERKTLETTLLLPVRRESLVAGKYLAVVTFSLLAFLLNFASMGLTLTHLRLEFELATLKVSVASILVIGAGAMLLAFFLSGVMMFLAFLARSFKEGQTYVMPVYLLAALSALVTSSPEASLTPALAWVPIVNVVLLFREALGGRLAAGTLAITFSSSAIYALLALGGAARLLRHETAAGAGEVNLRQVLASFGAGQGPGKAAGAGAPSGRGGGES